MLRPSSRRSRRLASRAEDGFRFVGYLPRRAAELRAAAGSWVADGGVVVAFETPRRLARSLAELAAVAPDVAGAVCRELTKLHEEVALGTLVELAERFAAGARGEITLVLDFGPGARRARGAVRLESGEASAAAASLLAKGLSPRDAATALAVCLGLSRNEAHRLVGESSRPR